MPDKTIDCPPCGGRGKVPGTVSVTCTVCRGRGQLVVDSAYTEKCRVCDGGGKVPGTVSVICTVCKGIGLRPPLIAVPAVEKLTAAKSESDPYSIDCYFIEAKKPRTAHLKLAELFQRLSGEIRICDPYYGTGSLLRLDLLKHCSPIRFLTKNHEKSEVHILPKALKEWSAQHSATEFGKVTGKSLHDRYILTDDEIVILGHGLKDIGGKDSFVFQIPKSHAEDLMDIVRTSFDKKWGAATPI